MEWNLIILFFVAASTGVHYQVLLQQSGAELRKPRSSGKVTYKASGYILVIHDMHWVKQASRQVLKWIGNICAGICGTNYNQKFKGKATQTTDKSSNTAYMEVCSLTSEDSSVYYFVRHSVATHILSVSQTLEEKLR